MDSTTKKPYQSLTLWSNLILAAASFFPIVKELVTPDLLGAIFFVVNTALRFKTNSGISLK
jgi:hypothetical protein